MHHHTGASVNTLALLPQHLGDRIAAGNSGCWIWRDRTDDDGYGRVSWAGREDRAHRVVYRLLIGPIPRHLVTDHLCRVRACVNPNHPELVTRRENTLRGVTGPAVNIRKTHCSAGHAYTPENTRMQGTRRRCRQCNRANHAAERLQRRERQLAKRMSERVGLVCLAILDFDWDGCGAGGVRGKEFVDVAGRLAEQIVRLLDGGGAK